MAPFPDPFALRSREAGWLSGVSRGLALRYGTSLFDTLRPQHLLSTNGVM
jgi:hypothetical protein